jgi:hypothetical protein
LGAGREASRKLATQDGRIWLWPHLNESGRVEVTVEGKRLTNPAAPHHCKAGRVHKRVLALRAATKPPPRVSLDSFIDVNDLDVPQRGEPVKESDCSGMSRATAYQSPGFADHVIGSEHAPDTAIYECASIVMSAVTTLLQPEPEAGIRESHRLRS